MTAPAAYALTGLDDGSGELTSGAALTLSQEQRAAVEWGDGPLMVLAGAGTGKTTVIVERVARLLATDESLRPENLLVLTYNVKAAAELVERLEQRLGVDDASRIALAGKEGHAKSTGPACRSRDPRSIDPVDPDRTAGAGPIAGGAQQPLHERIDDLAAAHAGQPLSGDPANAPVDARQPTCDARGRVGVAAVRDRALDRLLVRAGSGEGIPRRPERVDHPAAPAPIGPRLQLVERGEMPLCAW